MEIIRLPIGKQAPVDTDCIRIEQTDANTFKLTASPLRIDADATDSVSLIDGPTFDSVEQAEAAGLVWASNCGVERLSIVVGTLDNPLEVIEIDKAL